MTEIKLHTKVTQASDLLTTGLEDELVMMSLARGVYVALDAMAGRIWSELQEPITVADLRRRLLTEFDVPAETCEHDVLRLLNQLHEHHLISIVPSQAE